MERQQLVNLDRRFDENLEVIGFGPIESVVGLAALITHLRPASITMIGIAGTFDSDRHAVGSATIINRCLVDDIGVGVGNDGPFQSATSLGWPGNGPLDVTPRNQESAVSLAVSLSVSAASGGPHDAADRRRRFPSAGLEDMETYGVIHLCQSMQIEIEVIRGISNVVGDRDHLEWKIDDALGNANALFRDRRRHTT